MTRLATWIQRTSARALDQVLEIAAPSYRNVRRAHELHRDHARRCATYPAGSPSSAAAAGVLQGLLGRGHHVIEGYWDRDRCAAAVQEVDRVMREYPRFVQGPPASDFRIFGANNVSTLIARFGDDPLLAELATLHNRMPTRLGMTLAARLPAAGRNLGSGEGWHRDQFFVATKAMLYLTDVGPENGPFQMIGASFALRDVCRDIVQGGLAHLQYRIREDQVEALVRREQPRLLTFAAPAGTLIVFNASSIHRGKPIQAGERYALTNYYFTAEWTDAEITKNFPLIAHQ